MEAIEHPSPLVALINLLFAPLGIHVPDHMGVLEGRATVDGRVVVNGTMTFALGSE